MKCNTEKFLKQMQRNFYNNESLAKEAGISPQAVSDLKTGKRTPRAATLKKLCEAFKCKPEDILDD